MSWKHGMSAAVALMVLHLPFAAYAQEQIGTQGQTQAGGRSWRIDSFRADIRVDEAGDLHVTETIRPRFEGRYNGIYRVIPVEHEQWRFRRNVVLKVLSVTDGEGQDLRYETSRERGHIEVKVWIPDAVDTVRTVAISYRVERALLFFDADDAGDERGESVREATDELYWNVTGTEWPVPIGAASAIVTLPQDVTGVRARAFTGAFGSQGSDADVVVGPSRVEVQTQRELGFREGLTVGVAWDAGVVSRPSAIDRMSMWMMANWPLFFPFIAFAFMYRRWSERGRDPALGAIEPQYKPPGGLSPAEVGVVIDNTADVRDITATLVDLAVRGYLTIEEIDSSKLFGLMDSSDYVFRRTGKREAELAPHEKALLQAVFQGGKRRELSDLKNKFYRKLPGLKSQLLHALIEHRVYEEHPQRVIWKYVGLGVLVGVVIFFGGGLATSVIPLAPLAVVLSAAASVLVIVGFATVMPARTRQGTELLRQVKGFERFLERVESDRFRKMITGPEMFEQYLPYAMALGVETRWVGAFAEMYREPPRWYVGHGMAGRAFSVHMFASSLNKMTSQTHTAMMQAPRSVGQSSFGGGGGGFSGGGFGGGGGGAF